MPPTRLGCFCTTAQPHSPPSRLLCMLAWDPPPPCPPLSRQVPCPPDVPAARRGAHAGGPHVRGLRCALPLLPTRHAPWLHARLAACSHGCPRGPTLPTARASPLSPVPPSYEPASEHVGMFPIPHPCTAFSDPPAEDLISEAVCAAHTQRLVKPGDYVVCLKSVKGSMVVKVVQVGPRSPAGGGGGGGGRGGRAVRSWCGWPQLAAGSSYSLLRGGRGRGARALRRC
jgi:hypothetical protein